MPISNNNVFLNVPFDSAYENQFLALIVSLVCLGRVPRCVTEIPETGTGRRARLLKLIAKCRVSIHDLSRVGLPVRFNMPFELGIAYALHKVNGNHSFVILERERFRLKTTCTDLDGIDPCIHNGTVVGTIKCILNALGRPSGNPSVPEVLAVYRKLKTVSNTLKREHGGGSLFSRTLFLELVVAATDLCVQAELIKA